MRYPHIFSPLQLNKLTLPNRIYSSAHAEVYAEAGGLPGDRYIRYYEEKAKGGLGMAICGGSSPVSIDIPQGAWRPVNLTKPPFLLPAPQSVILEECTEEDGAYADKALAVWRLSDLPLELAV